MKIVLLGPPGAGKGTQAALIHERFDLPHVSTGDMLRSAIREGTRLGLEAKAYINKGELVPDDVVIGIVRERLSEDDCSEGFLLDGFPRTVAQAEAMDSFTDLDATILIDVDPESLVARITERRTCPNCRGTYRSKDLKDDICPVCGAGCVQRDDDQEETVRNRLSVYERQTSPLVAYYRDRGILRTVDGDGDIDEVFADICAIMER